MLLLWDGSHLGDISEYFISINEPEDGKIGSKLNLKIKNRIVTCYAWKFKNKLPLLIDELKPLFGIPKIGRHTCIIHENHLLIARCINKNENIYDSLIHEIDNEKMEELITLRHIFGILGSSNSFWYRPTVGVMLYRDITINFDKKTSKISDSLINKYFDSDRERVELAMERLLRKSCVSHNINPSSPTHLLKIQQLLRIEIEKVIRRLDPDLIYINVCILSRIQNLLGTLHK